MVRKNERKYSMNGTIRNDIQIGIKVSVVQKQDQRCGKLNEGKIQKILTNQGYTLEELR